jgi:tetratricopeptide (TPR) repeat protein
MKPICFVVMPFGLKDVGTSLPGAPAQVDFNALWTKAICPAIEKLGYEPVRADQDSGSLIIHEMLERLFFADLVVADMSIPNGNVYYEVGIRHAAKPDKCVLIAAQWALPLFDTNQMRRVTYTLNSSVVSDEDAVSICEYLVNHIPKLREGQSPMHIALPGYPAPDPARATTMRAAITQHTTFLQRIEGLSELSKDDAKAAVEALAFMYPASAVMQASQAVPLALAIRDYSGWQAAITYIDALPGTIQELPLLKEQRALALSKSGDHQEAIIALNTLMQLNGRTSERLGLIGGRYKKLSQSNTNPRALERSIEHYEAGAELEVGDFYCISNLARLYRERGEDGDDEKAEFAQNLTVYMAEVAIKRGKANEWTRPTLLGAAFDAGNVAKATELVAQVKKEGVVAWKLQTTLNDLDKSAKQQINVNRATALTNLIAELKTLL